MTMPEIPEPTAAQLAHDVAARWARAAQDDFVDLDPRTEALAALAVAQAALMEACDQVSRCSEEVRRRMAQVARFEPVEDQP